MMPVKIFREEGMILSQASFQPVTELFLNASEGLLHPPQRRAPAVVCVKVAPHRALGQGCPTLSTVVKFTSRKQLKP